MNVPDDTGRSLGELRREMNKRLSRIADGMAEPEVKAILGEPTTVLIGSAAREYDDDINTIFAYRDPYRQNTTHYFGFSGGSLQLRLREIVGP